MWFGIQESHGNSPQNKAKSFRLTAINDDEAFDHASIRKRFSLNSHQKHASLFRGVVALFVIVALILPPPQPPQQEERRKTAASQERWVVGLSDRLIPPAADLCGTIHLVDLTVGGTESGWHLTRDRDLDAGVDDRRAS
ncbi:hypothetical protein BHM03_00040766 [Ensete ventricosum]|uniref:Uncharacterized protein n=1 Tax=Ensete ventricosum TaxID=4639 RepID=A0A445MKC9_ENSVE|nr:hypothetical protein BHM03_00040766 [Ensete ventricosum]